MIVVIEGASASGKTTWCQTYHPTQTLPEHPPRPDAPSRESQPLKAAQFWVTANIERWRAAQRASSLGQLVVCDTDPFKLHYVWSLWRIGEASETAWCAEAQLARDAFASADLGLADLVLVADESEDIVRARMRSDSTRSRHRFELHLRLTSPLREWYEAVARVDDRRVVWGLPEAGLGGDQVALGGRQVSSGLELFDAVLAGLPDTPALREG